MYYRYAPADVVAGMWVGESWPSPELLAVDPSVPTNPIRWSLALDPSGGSSVSAFGAGFFDDAVGLLYIQVECS